MPDYSLKAAQMTDLIDKGILSVQVTSALGQEPVKNARIQISYSNAPETVVEQVTTNESGETENIELAAPPVELSQEPSEIQPYSDYNLLITAEGYEPVTIEGSEILSGETSIQPVRMNPLEEENLVNSDIVIGDHTLFGDYPPKIPEAEIKPMAETGEIVLSRVVVPEYVIVHNGTPDNTGATNYYVKYKDYIKNVVSSEIYATWPESTIYANTLCILSFTLNRVFTEWYRGKGYDFTITNSTAYDQKWIYGRNVYENISQIVDGIFNNYLSRPGVKQPIFTSYCDGRQVSCAGLKQWGSKYLGDEGYSAIEIIRYYFGEDMYINTAEAIAGVPASWPGYELTVGSSGDKVRQMQQQLARIARNYPAIPKIEADGVYGTQTQEAVRTFQKIFNLPQTGVVDFATWYAISNIYVGVTRAAEPG